MVDIDQLLTSFITSGVRTLSATRSTLETLICAGKFFCIHNLCLWTVESCGVQSLSTLFSFVNLRTPKRHTPQIANEIKMVIHGLPPTTFPNLNMQAHITYHISRITHQQVRLSSSFEHVKSGKTLNCTTSTPGWGSRIM